MRIRYKCCNKMETTGKGKYHMEEGKERRPWKETEK
jgi:hypothetical protein